MPIKLTDEAIEDDIDNRARENSHLTSIPYHLEDVLIFLRFQKNRAPMLIRIARLHVVEQG